MKGPTRVGYQRGLAISFVKESAESRNTDDIVKTRTTLLYKESPKDSRTVSHGMESTQGQNTEVVYTMSYQGINQRSKHGQCCGDTYTILGQGIE